MTALVTIADLLADVEKRFVVSEVSPRADGVEFKPIEGWHTIRVGSGYFDCDPGTIRTWARLFGLYAQNRVGKGLFWRDVPHFDREKRELIGVFCIQ